MFDPGDIVLYRNSLIIMLVMLNSVGVMKSDLNFLCGNRIYNRVTTVF